MKAFGLDITIESPKGTLRHGSDWTQLMRNDYGYIDNTIAIDGDELDCFIGPNMESKKVFIIDQVNPSTKEFDEFKLMLGFNNHEEAVDAYYANYQRGWNGMRSVQYIPLENFKNWYSQTLAHLYAST